MICFFTVYQPFEDYLRPKNILVFKNNSFFAFKRFGRKKEKTKKKERKSNTRRVIGEHTHTHGLRDGNEEEKGYC